MFKMPPKDMFGAFLGHFRGGGKRNERPWTISEHVRLILVFLPCSDGGYDGNDVHTVYLNAYAHSAGSRQNGLASLMRLVRLFRPMGRLADWAIQWSMV